MKFLEFLKQNKLGIAIVVRGCGVCFRMMGNKTQHIAREIFLAGVCTVCCLNAGVRAFQRAKNVTVVVEQRRAQVNQNNQLAANQQQRPARSW